MSSAEDFKAQGNAALQAKKFTEAIECYTKAINLDGSNEIYYSNRSAAYLSMGDAQNALNDANACIGLNPDFTKGYSRKGSALHALKRYNDSIAAYEEGLSKFPDDKGLKSGLEAAKKAKEGPAPSSRGGMPNLFGPEMMAKIALDPKLRGYMSDPDFMAKLNKLQTDPNSLATMLSDPRIMEVFQVILGANGMEMKTGDEFRAEQEAKQASPPKKETKPEPEPEPEPMETEEEEDVSGLSPEELKIREDKKAAIAAKENGNTLYKSKKFDEAIAAYDEAIRLDPTNMTFMNNKAAVYFTTKKYDECIEACLKAVEIGKENRAPYEDRAKAYTRAAKAYEKKGDLSTAIEMCRSAQLEHYDKTTERLMKTMELDKKKADTLAYQDDEKAEEAKQLGNSHFRNKEWAEAVAAYEDAVKRAPKNAAIRNNLAAALCKIMDFNGAKREIEVALELDPKYVKAWAKKGDIEVLMKENHKALDSYKKGLEIEPDNAPCKEGIRKVTAMINYGQANMSEEERKERAAHALADPEIQSILQDPIINQVLRDFNENPQAANEAMRDPLIRSKIEKLIAGGILQTA
jgi:stress-induced-phosphoprotein 1